MTVGWSRDDIKKSTFYSSVTSTSTSSSTTTKRVIKKKTNAAIDSDEEADKARSNAIKQWSNDKGNNFEMKSSVKVMNAVETKVKDGDKYVTVSGHKTLKEKDLDVNLKDETGSKYVTERNTNVILKDGKTEKEMEETMREYKINQGQVEGKVEGKVTKVSGDDVKEIEELKPVVDKEVEELKKLTNSQIENS